MKDEDLRFFLAHDIRVPSEQLNDWRDALTEQLSDGYPDKMVTVVLARDDYEANFKDAGGWRGWPRRVANGTLWDGTPCFHGIIRPSTFPKESYCGRATFDLMAGFLRERKPTWLWNQNDSTFHVVSACERVPGDDYTMWGRLGPEEQR